MTIPTTNFGWLKPEGTEKANITVVNTAFQAMDASMKSISDTAAIKHKIIGCWIVDKQYTVNDVSVATSTPLRDVNDPAFWKQEWLDNANHPGVAGGFSFNTNGKFSFTSPGIYRLTYSVVHLTSTTDTEGWKSVGLYLSSNPATLVARSLLKRKANINNSYTVMTGTMLVRADTSGADVNTSTDYNLGLAQSGSFVYASIINPHTYRQSGFETRLQIEYVRAL